MCVIKIILYNSLKIFTKKMIFYIKHEKDKIYNLLSVCVILFENYRADKIVSNLVDVKLYLSSCVKFEETSSSILHQCS